MSRWIGWLAVWVVMTPVAAWAGDEPYQLLQQGSFHGDEIAALGKDIRVLALHLGEQRATLEQETVDVVIERDEIVDGKDEQTGKRVERKKGDLNREPEVMIQSLVKEAAELKSGEVPQAKKSLECLKRFHEEKGKLTTDSAGQLVIEKIDMAPYNALPCMLQLGDKTYSLRLDNPKLTDDAYPAYVVDVEVTLGDTKQQLEGVADIIFAGDIDRDGKLDLLVDRIDHYNIWVHKVLLLSGQATSGNLMRRVASLMGVGC